jgi:hypothetical protein
MDDWLVGLFDAPVSLIIKQRRWAVDRRYSNLLTGSASAFRLKFSMLGPLWDSHG